MHIRRAMAAAVGAAALAPAVLIAAPALAADSSPAAAASDPASATADATASQSASAEASASSSETPSESPSVTASASSSESASASPSSSASASASSSASGSPTPTASAPATQSPSPSASASSTPSSSPSSSPSSTPSSSPSSTPSDYCADTDIAYQSALGISITGLAGQIAQGSGWHEFSLTVDNPTSKAIDGIDLWTGALGGNGDPYSTQQVNIQAYDPDQQVWFDVASDGLSVADLGPGDMPAGSSYSIRMRLQVTSAAPVGKGVSIGYGAYADAQQNCIAESYGSATFTVVAAGRASGGTATHSGTHKTTTATPAKNSGGHKALPGSDTNNAAGTSGATLAKTGASSQLPLVGGIGAAAVAAGAGLVYVVRRRQAD